MLLRASTSSWSSASLRMSSGVTARSVSSYSTTRTSHSPAPAVRRKALGRSSEIELSWIRPEVLETASRQDAGRPAQTKATKEGAERRSSWCGRPLMFPPMSELDLFLFSGQGQQTPRGRRGRFRDRRLRDERLVDRQRSGAPQSAAQGGLSPGGADRHRRRGDRHRQPRVRSTAAGTPTTTRTLNLGRFRLALTRDENAVADPLPKAVRDILAEGPRGERSPEQEKRACSATGARPCPSGRKPTRGSRSCSDDHPEGATQLVLRERDDQRLTHTSASAVTFSRRRRRSSRASPSSCTRSRPRASRTGSTSLAGWSARSRPRRPARSSTVCGRPISERGWSRPSRTSAGRRRRPRIRELLDWLAVEFMDRGWSLKELHRLIVTSSAYRQDSRVTPELLEKDPNNRLLSRGPALPGRGRDRARHRAGGKRPAQREGGRPAGVPAGARVSFPAAGELRPEALVRRAGRGSLPPLALYVPLTARRPTRCSIRSTHRGATRRASAGVRSNSPLQALATLNETSVSRGGPRAG